VSLIENHFEEQRNKIKHYFSSLSTQVYDWVRIPYYESSAQPENLTLRKDEEPCKLQSDWTLRMRFTDLSLYKFRISVKEEYLTIHRKTINILLQFLTYYSVSKIFLV
jgi:hypothetical protein